MLTEPPMQEVGKQTQAQVSYGYRGSYRVSKVSPCTITIEDLCKLYSRLSGKTSEALEMYLGSIVPQPGQDGAQFEKIKNEARRMGHLAVIIIGANGEQIVDSRVEALAQNDLPDKIVSITFDSASALKGFNIILPNSFRLNLDFTEPPGFHAYNPWDQPTPNNSVLEVAGSNVTARVQRHNGRFPLDFPSG